MRGTNRIYLPVTLLARARDALGSNLEWIQTILTQILRDFEEQTERIYVPVTLLARDLDVLGSNLEWILAILTQILRDFPLYFQSNTGLEFKFGFFRILLSSTFIFYLIFTILMTVVGGLDS